MAMVLANECLKAYLSVEHAFGSISRLRVDASAVSAKDFFLSVAGLTALSSQTINTILSVLAMRLLEL